MAGTSSLPISPDAERGYGLLREDCGLLRLGQFAVAELTGDDRKGWLQGQITNDMRKVTPGASIRFCICSPTGQILADCDLWALPDRYVLTTEEPTMPAVAQRCETMIILEDVAYKSLQETHELISIQGPSATSRLTSLLQLPTLDAGIAELEGQEIWCLRSNRTGYGGWDLVLPRGSEKALKKLTATFEEASADAYEVARLEAGIPRYGLDITTKTLPPELGPAFENSHISYNKGCYTGQEVLMRIYSRGHTNKTWMGLLADQPFEVGATVSHSSRLDAGTVTSAVFSPRYGYIGAAVLRNEAAFPGEIVSITTSGDALEAEVIHMPILTNA